MVPVAKSPKLGMEWNVLRCGYILGTRGGNGGRINKTLRFCRRCIDVVFILSSLMSTCELDRFVIQTPYIKVLKSCSALRLWTGRVSTTTTRTSDDGQTYGMDRPTDRRNERERRWINVKPVSSFVRSWIPATLVSQYTRIARPLLSVHVFSKPPMYPAFEILFRPTFMKEGKR